YLESCSSDTLLTFRMGRGMRLPIMSTSIGRALLAALSQQERQFLLESLRQHNDPDFTPAGLMALEREISRYQDEGICLSLGEWNADVNAAATTVRWPGANDVIVLSISGPSFLITEEILKETLIQRLKQLSQHISSQLSSFSMLYHRGPCPTLF